MSAGQFQRSRYQSSYNADANIHPIRVQPETLLLQIDGTANTPPTNAVTNPISAVTSRNKRARGLRPATVSLTSPATPPDGYKVNGITEVPLLNTAIRDKAAIADTATTVTYLGVAGWTVSGYSAEEAK